MVAALKLQVALFVHAGNSVMQAAPPMAGQAVDKTARGILPSLDPLGTERVGTTAGAIIAVIPGEVGVACQVLPSAVDPVRDFFPCPVR
ncbi:hypothetical protein ES703_99309 [subsurface metagenome]